MKPKRSILAVLLASSLAACLFLQPNQLHESMGQQTAAAFSNRLLVKGSAGGDVYELQSRLRHLGYYSGRIDGVFGWQTYWSVRNFQSRFGLRVDGKVGPHTRAKLLAATPHFAPRPAPPAAHTARTARTARWNPTHPAGHPATAIPLSASVSSRVSTGDLRLMANAVNGEARGESYEGQVAVAAVILNRLKSPLFPHSIAGIIYQPGAFTAVSDGQINLPPQPGPKKAVIEALNGWDPSDGAIYYFNPATATSPWIWSRPQIKTIGHHIFCR